MPKTFKKVLVANRGEIAIRIMRACQELGIRTIAIYSEEDQLALFRNKADEAYLVGKNKSPIDAYLSMEEIIDLAVRKGVDAIHPGYGFLAENPTFVQKCANAGIEFIGPTAQMMEKLGDKIQSKLIAKSVGVPVIAGTERPIRTDAEGLKMARQCGYPVILKAAAGGGGRGMRIVQREEELLTELESARNEAGKAFGNADIFIEKYLHNPKHIEVQILGDKYGNLIHLYERDCSIQRRHQKLIEFTPAFALPLEKRNQICEDALKIAKAVRYQSAGTVEFLVDAKGNHYFIEMNPRIQVEHTVTEMVTGIDIVQSQIKVAEGYPLHSAELGIPSQHAIKPRGYSIQCRITTEDPMKQFAPDHGRLDVYRTGSGFGVRLDGGNGFTGSIITPYYDSLLVKITTWSRSFDDAIRKAVRSIKETQVSGVKINDAFLINVLNHPTFRKGKCHTRFFEEAPELFDLKPQIDEETQILRFLGEKVVNETHGIKPEFNLPYLPKLEHKSGRQSQPALRGTRQILEEEGPAGVVSWIKGQQKLLLTDTTYRDAHQSLIATRMRTKDMLQIAEAVQTLGHDLFSLEMWGGATFDVAYRFLRESPWKRLTALRERIPHILFQMLLRASNGVGYTNYPDNLIQALITEAATNGIDLFRIFDSLNWLPGLEVAVEQVLKTGKLAEVCICYTGDILDQSRSKYNLDYYLKLAKEIEQMGAHILAIKDMAGLLKPYAAKVLIEALKVEVDLPIHLHTHDTSGNGIATLLMAAEAGVDIVDTAFNSMAGLTSQPALNSVVAALEQTERDTGLLLTDLQEIADYWQDIRPIYAKFESGLKSGTAEIYKYEIPGGQYSNLRSQVASFGLEQRFNEVKEMYREVNQMLGDIIKVTPTSKVVGDLAIFMVQNNLTPASILEQGKQLAFPDSVVSYFKGMMGQPLGGFPRELQRLVLKGEQPLQGRPGEILPPVDFGAMQRSLEEKYRLKVTQQDLLSYALYPKVFAEYLQSLREYGDLSNLDTHIYLYGLAESETAEIELEEGRILIVKLVEVGKLDLEGERTVVFEVNGNRREIRVRDRHRPQHELMTNSIRMADPENEGEIGANIPGTIMKVLVQEGDQVEANQRLAVIEAMKMETNIVAPQAGTIQVVAVQAGQQVKDGELLFKLSE